MTAGRETPAVDLARAMRDGNVGSAVVTEEALVVVALAYVLIEYGGNCGEE